VSTKASTKTPAARTVPDAMDGVDGLDGPAVPKRGSVGRTVWLFLTSMRTGLGLILIVGLLTFAGTMLAQVPSGIVTDTDYQSWYLSAAAPRYGGWAPVLGALGLYRVFSSWYFIGLFALLAASILSCSINRTPKLWRAATRPHTSMSAAFYAKAPLHTKVELDADVAQATKLVQSALSSRRFRILSSDPASGEADLYADRNRWAPFGTVIAHLSFVVIMSAFAVSGMFGFKNDSFIAPIGVPVDVGFGTGLTLTALSFNDTYYDNGSPKDYVSDLVLAKDGVQVARQQTRVNAPLIYDGVWFHQSFFGIGADVKVTKDGKTLFDENVPLQYVGDDGQRSFGIFTIPELKVTVYAIQAASGHVVAELPPGAMIFEVHPDGGADPVFQTVDQGRSVDIGGATYSFARNRQFTGLTVSEDPGSVLVWIGSGMLILGCCLVFFFPHRRIWVRVRAGAHDGATVELAAPQKRDVGFAPEFEEIAGRIAGTPDQDLDL